MNDAPRVPRIEELLEHADWVRRLARRLVLDAATAEDLVQETWVRALEKPPRHTGNLRAWLGTVVRNVASGRGRAEARRDRRERAGARPEAVFDSEGLAREASRTSEVVEAVLALPEPYRTVLLLRWFKERTPAQIARELGRPPATIKTQLQRGLERLRQCFDDEYGDRRQWCLALLPLARLDAPAAGGLAVTAGASAGALALGAFLWIASRPTEPPVAPTTLAPLASTAPPGDDDGATELVALEGDERALLDNSQPTALEDEAAPPAAAPSPNTLLDELELSSLGGLLLDLEGRPLAGARVTWVDNSDLRWADASKRVLTGQNVWQPIAGEVRARLAADPVERLEFALAHFPRPDRAFALLGGEEPPVYRATTDANGRFELRVPGYGRELTLEGGQRQIHGRSRRIDEFSGEEELVWFAARAVRVEGRVVDSEGLPLANVRVNARAAGVPSLNEFLALGYGVASREFTARSSADGSFVFESLPHEGRVALEVQREGSLPWSAEWVVPDDSVVGNSGASLRGEIRLVALAPPVVRALVGVVRHENGTPAPRALVMLAGRHCESDDEGRYRLAFPCAPGATRVPADHRSSGFVSGGPPAGSFEAAGPSPSAPDDLFAARAGGGIGTVLGAGALLGSEPGDYAGPDVVLPDESLALAGRVVDASGRGVAGVTVSLEDRLRLADGRGSLEDFAAGRSFARTETDAHGRFALDGLRDAPYRLTVYSDGRTRRSGPHTAGTTDLELALPRDE